MTRKNKQYKIYSDLLQNLRQGLPLALFRPVRLRRFRVAPEQAVLLMLLDVMLDLLFDYLHAGLGATFNVYGISYAALTAVLVFVAWYFLALLHRRQSAVVVLLVMASAMAPVFYAVQLVLVWAGLYGSQFSWGGAIAYGAMLAWYVAVVFRILRLVFVRPRLRAFSGTAVYFLVAIVPLYLIPQQSFWLPTPAAQAAVSPARRVNAERVFDAQHGLIEQEKGRLQRQRPGRTDVYFVGFGSYATEDVFMKEVRTIRTLFDTRFDSAGRSVALINNPATVEDTPIASGTNLGKVLQHVGSLMDKNEDLLVLYLTSHGSKRHRLSVDFWPLALNSINPDTLKQALDVSGIRWKVVIISACYSGGFIEKLRDDYTLVMTSSDSQRESFGCGAGSDFTYFGQALLDVELRRTFSFVDAFDAAERSIVEREKQERLKPSKPQIALGNLIAPKLDALSRDLESRAAASLPNETGERGAP